MVQVKSMEKYDNGDSRLLGQIAVASFANPAGLEAIGNSMFAATQNSGLFDGIDRTLPKVAVVYQLEF